MVICLFYAPAAEPHKKGDQNSFRTDLRAFHDHSQTENGLIMSCMGVPSINSDHALRDLSTDHVAFYATADDATADDATADDATFDLMSTSSFWRCSLMHCREAFQLSPCGAATYVFCRVGCRAYFLAWKKVGPILEGFVQEPFGEWCPSDDWEVEMVLVPAGSTL